MLCQLQTLKDRLKLPESDVVDDDILTNFILAVSGRFARECNRIFDYSDSATFDFRADEMNVAVNRYPIVLPLSFAVKTTEPAGFVLESIMPDYVLNPTKSIIELAAPLGSSRQIARVTFEGGYALPGNTPSGSEPALPDEIEQACVEQCVFYYQNKDRLGLAGVSAEGGSISKLATADLLPHVQVLLKKYERWMN